MESIIHLNEKEVKAEVSKRHGNSIYFFGEV